MNNKRVLFELCCGSVDDVLAAKAGGADRVELNSSMFLGGITPSLGALIEVKKRVPGMPVMCMVRPREGGFCYTECEYTSMLTDAKLFIEHGAEGIVFGFLKEDGTVDQARCKEMLSVIGAKQSVFHRAIDVVPDVFAALDTLIDLGVTRVLTSGQKPAVQEGAPLIRRMIEHAKGRIEIQPGGGIELHNAKQCIEETGATMIHAMLHKNTFDRSTMKNPSIHFGGALYPSEEVYLVGDSAMVAQMMNIVQP